jgi:N-acetylneuraminate lyase
MEPRFAGIIAATYTPMHSDGSVDLGAIPRLVDFVLASGVDGVFVCGTTGEFASLSVEERHDVAEAFSRAVDGRAPLIVHVGHNCLRDARTLASHAAKIGAAAVSACAPSYFKPRDVGALLECCMHISDAAPSLPFFFYHIPVFTGVSLSVVELLREAAERMPSLVGVKYSSPTLYELTDCINRFKGQYTLMFGVDEMLLSALAAGAPAAVGSTYNYAARLYQRMWAAFESGDIETARIWQDRSVQFINLQAEYGGLRASKAMMKLVGVDCGPPRLPLQPLTPEEERTLQERLTNIGFFGWIAGE